MRKAKLLFIVAIIAVTITNIKCTKDAFNLQKSPQEVLSKNAQDYSERLQAIQKNFYALKLDEKFKPKVKQDIIWTPDWEHPTSQVISDFGQALRAKNGANTNPGSGIQGKGECN